MSRNLSIGFFEKESQFVSVAYRDGDHESGFLTMDNKPHNIETLPVSPLSQVAMGSNKW